MENEVPTDDSIRLSVRVQGLMADIRKKRFKCQLLPGENISGNVPLSIQITDAWLVCLIDVLVAHFYHSIEGVSGEDKTEANETESDVNAKSTHINVAPTSGPPQMGAGDIGLWVAIACVSVVVAWLIPTWLRLAMVMVNN